MKEEMTRVSRRVRTSAADRDRLVRGFQKSGQPGRVFAREHGIGYSTLSKWIREARSGPKQSVVLQEVSLVPQVGRENWVAEVARPDGCTVRVSRDVPSNLLRVLLRS